MKGKKKNNGQEEKEWTVMVYLSGDNNLSSECVWSLKEMYRAGLRHKDIALLVQIDPRASRPRLYDVGRDLQESIKESQPELGNAPSPDVISDNADGFLFSRSQDVPPVEQKAAAKSAGGQMAARLSDRDRMSSREALSAFITESKRCHPAKRYLLILAGHGGGALGHSFLVDDFPGSGLDMAELKQVLSEAGSRIDVLGMDSCSMGMAEVGFELRNSVEYLVAAEGFELNTGWPYHKLLEALNDYPQITPRDLAIRIVDDYTNYYSDYVMAGVSTDIAACHLRRGTDLARAVGTLAKTLRSRLPSRTRRQVEDLGLADRAVADAVVLAHWRAQSYRFEEYTDLLDFCRLLQNGCKDVLVRDACEEVESIIEGKELADKSYDGYVVRSGRSGGDFQHSHGVSIYFPWAIFLDEYRELSFAAKTGWGNFLEAYVNHTRRQPRPGRGKLLPILEAGESAPVVRESSLLNSRDSSLLNSRDSALLNSRGGQIIVPQVKNPPRVFFQSDAPKRNGSTKR